MNLSRSVDQGFPREADGALSGDSRASSARSIRPRGGYFAFRRAAIFTSEHVPESHPHFVPLDGFPFVAQSAAAVHSGVCCSATGEAVSSVGGCTALSGAVGSAAGASSIGTARRPEGSSVGSGVAAGADAAAGAGSTGGGGFDAQLANRVKTINRENARTGFIAIHSTSKREPRFWTDVAKRGPKERPQKGGHFPSWDCTSPAWSCISQECVSAGCPRGAVGLTPTGASQVSVDASASAGVAADPGGICGGNITLPHT